MKILFLSRWYPYPPDNGAKLRVYHLLQGLAQAHEVHLLSFCDQAKPGNSPPPGLLQGARTVPWREFNPRSRGALLGLFSPTPRSLIDTYSPEMELEIRRALQAQRFDLVIASQWQMTAYRHIYREIPALYEEIEVGVLYGQYKNAASLPARLRAGLTWRKHSRYLRRLLAGGQPCTVVSEAERRLLETIAPGSAAVHVIPNGVNLAAYQGITAEPEPGSLIYTGSFRYRANYEAMLWFVERVLPLVQAQVPEARLTITGDHAGLPLPPNPGVTLTGYVDDVRPLIARSWASLAPLQTGGGTRLKILESMALCTPVISTAKGAEGLQIDNGRHALIADDPRAFADHTIRLLRDRRLRDQIASRAYQLVRDTYDWQVIMPRFLAVVDQAAQGRTE